VTNPDRNDLFEFLLRLGDERLVLGHRLSEWCGHGPELEEDIALANLALDNLGQASAWLELAARVENRGRDADQMVYFREAIDFRNVLLVEQPNRDFAATVARQYLFDSYSRFFYRELCQSAHPEISAIATKSATEIRYHLRHSSQWVLRLGDGTPESHSRMQAAFDRLWRFVPELFASDEIEQRLIEQSICPDRSGLFSPWLSQVSSHLEQATLDIPEGLEAGESPGFRGWHSEHLGHLLAEMQIVARSFPGANW
jgi:ring-1,2-phenylacetyl-CoA epoxidase subunit PaaC